MLQLIQRLLGRQRTTLPPFDFSRIRYRAKKQWPPNLRELTERQQFRFERKFKRRLRLKSIKPMWQKWTKILQWSLIGFVVVYGVFFHDFANDKLNPRPGEQPFKGLRAWMKSWTDMIWTHNSESTDKGRTLNGAEEGHTEKKGVSTLDSVREVWNQSPAQRQAQIRNQEIARDQEQGFHR